MSACQKTDVACPDLNYEVASVPIWPWEQVEWIWMVIDGKKSHVVGFSITDKGE